MQECNETMCKLDQFVSVFCPSQALSLCCLDLQYMVDCSQVNYLPTLSFVISGATLPLPPSAYITQASYHVLV